jgi:hypothetical protein
VSTKFRIYVHQSTKCGFSKKVFHRQYFFLFPYVLLTCYHHLRAKLGMYITLCIFLNFWQVCNQSLFLQYQHPFWYSESIVQCFPLINHYFYKKLSLYVQIPNKYLGLGFDFEFGPQRIWDLAIVCPKYMGSNKHCMGRNSMERLCKIWQYRLWSFQGMDTKSERFLAKNQL